MQGNNTIDKLLISFLLKELDPEEEAFVLRQINSDSEVRNRFAELQNTWKLVVANKNSERINVAEEWNNFEQAIAKKKQPLVPIKTTVTAEEHFVAEESIVHPGRIRKIVIAISVAASILLAMIIMFEWFAESGSVPNLAAKIPELKATQISRVIHEINNSGKRKKIQLDDGTEIILENKTEVSFNQPFINKRRDITLTGAADFKVAKDKSRPFTVYSMDIATTALGTHFTVSALKQAENIMVTLFEGKVVIRSLPGLQNQLDSDYYLVPGQALVYNNKNFTARRSNFSLTNEIASAKNRNPGVPHLLDEVELPEHKEGSWYMFNNQSAKQVFDLLADMYHAEIIYSAKDVKNLYLIIEFNKSDSLDKVLARIAVANNLKVAKDNNKFVISK